MQTDVKSIFQKQKAKRWELAQSGPEERKKKLLKLKSAIESYVPQLQDALLADFKKPAAEVELTEILPVLEEINFAVKNLKKWHRPRKVPTPLTLFPASSQVRYEPKGVVLIMSPWNYPFHLFIAPLVGAIAAGNCVMMRSSSKVPRTAKVLKEMIGATFPEDEVAVIEGDSKIADALLELPFDHFFFTGSTRIGVKVMQAAATHFATVTLELGGKSPAIIGPDANLESAAEKIVWGKFLNAGQTCVAPDYVMVPKSLAAEFVSKTVARIQKVYGNSEEAIAKNTDFARVIDDASLKRLLQLMETSIQQGAKLACGGKSETVSRYLSPTVLSEVSFGHPIMSQEIFGPILPIIAYDDIEQVLRYLQSQAKPLAMYLFSRSNSFLETVLTQTSAGGTVINNVLIHLANPNLPFGGAGASGQGNYHGFFGYKTFSHERAVIRQNGGGLTGWFSAPYRGTRLNLAVRLFRWAVKSRQLNPRNYT